jgi:hypothetical protein
VAIIIMSSLTVIAPQVKTIPFVKYVELAAIESGFKALGALSTTVFRVILLARFELRLITSIVSPHLPRIFPSKPDPLISFVIFSALLPIT